MTRADNAQRKKAVTANCRAFNLGLSGRVAPEAWLAILVLWNHRCAYCGHAPSGGWKDVIHMDHVEPLDRGGEHSPDNIVPACHRCNASKVDFFLLEWVFRGAGVLCGKSHASVRVRELFEYEPKKGRGTK